MREVAESLFNKRPRTEPNRAQSYNENYYASGTNATSRGSRNGYGNENEAPRSFLNRTGQSVSGLDQYFRLP